MIRLPFLALNLFFTRPRLFALGVFPGIFTFVASCAAVITLWNLLLQGLSLWITLPAMMGTLFLTWLVVGHLALLPVEDALIDECQKAIWQEVRLPAPSFQISRLLREALFSLALGITGLLVLLLSFVPFLSPLTIALAGWLTAYSFLSPMYSRRDISFSKRWRLFFEHPFSNLLLGSALNILLFVPVLNVFLLGYAQVLAGLVYIDRENRAR